MSNAPTSIGQIFESYLLPAPDQSTLCANPSSVLIVDEDRAFELELKTFLWE